MTNQANNNDQQMGGFAAGALVHTKEGLKPIEKIKVGDWVLSQPEEGGEKAYKRVAKTFRFEDEVVWSVSYYEKDAWDKVIAENTMLDYSDFARVVVTPNHPFWVKDRGWVCVSDLDIHDQIQLENGRLALIKDVTPLYKHRFEGMAWRPNLAPGRDPLGKLIDFNEGKSGEFDFQRKSWDWEHLDDDLNDSAFYYRTTVYNFEVEDFHTYYVGTKGVWVHNSCAMDTVNIEISIQNQTLTLLDNTGYVKANYSISTAANGAGCDKNSGCTPLGAHIIRAKIGAGAPLNTVF